MNEIAVFDQESMVNVAVLPGAPHTTLPSMNWM
jgi:hypothetical protein